MSLSPCSQLGENPPHFLPIPHVNKDSLPLIPCPCSPRPSRVNGVFQWLNWPLGLIKWKIKLLKTILIDPSILRIWVLYNMSWNKDLTFKKQSIRLVIELNVPKPSNAHNGLLRIFWMHFVRPFFWATWMGRNQRNSLIEHLF